MPGNIEIKARVKSAVDLRFKAKEISFQQFLLEQRDTFFASPTGARFKLRVENDVKDGSTKETTAQLIAYMRPNVTGAKYSQYNLTPVSDPESMEETLKVSNGILGVVEKRRDVYLVIWQGMKARVHLDMVKNLGDFLEFEVIVNDEAELEEAHSFAKWLSNHFGIKEEDTVSGAYFNLLEEARAAAGDE